MMSTLKWAAGSGCTLLAAVLGWFVFYPERSEQTKQNVEAIGAVALDKILAAMEERVGKTDVALEHYKTAQQAKRQALVNLKTLKADTERKADETRASVADLQAKGDEAAAAGKKAELAVYEQQLSSLSESVAKAETAYKEFNLFLKNKTIELATLKAKTQTLRAELTALSGGDGGYAMQRARQLEDEVKSACSRLEAEMEVQRIDNESK